MTTFDPVAFKTTTRRQWEEAAAAWHRWGPTLETWLGPATELMLDRTGVTAGSRVLDVAAGAGGQTLAAARRVGADGRVVATDLSPTILAYAAETAADEGLANVETIELDGEAVGELEGGAFDAVISRVGLIYFPDQAKALAGMRHALRDGGKIGAVVYSTADRNQFFSLPVSIIRTRAQLPPPLPGQPGPFSLGGDGVLAAAFENAGFHDVHVDTIAAPLRLSTAAECVLFERDSFGALHQMLSTVPESDRESVWDEIHTALSQFDSPDGFVAPCEMLVAVGTK